MAIPVISLKASYNSVIRGCPGLPDTLPRIECELRVRSSNGKPIRIRQIDIMLKTIEAIHPFHSFSSKHKLEKSTTHYKKQLNLSGKNIIGIDIPVTIGLPDSIKETNYNLHFGKCVTILECNVFYSPRGDEFGKSDVKTHVEYINVERYSNLATKRKFPPVKRKTSSLDKKFSVEYALDNPCITTDDMLRLNIMIKPTSITSTGSQRGLFNKKIKLKNITYELQEHLEVHDQNTTDTRSTVLKAAVQQVNQTISTNGLRLTSNIPICTKNSLFKDFETSMQEPAFLYRLPSQKSVDSPSLVASNEYLQSPAASTQLIQNKSTDLIPLQYHTSISTSGKLFSIFHVLNMRFKINNGKDFEVHQLVTISAWPLTQIKYIEQIIDQERETAKYATQFYENYGGIKRNKYTGLLEYPPLPPVIYDGNESQLKSMDICYDTNHKTPRRIPIIE